MEDQKTWKQLSETRDSTLIHHSLSAKCKANLSRLFLRSLLTWTSRRAWTQSSSEPPSNPLRSVWIAARPTVQRSLSQSVPKILVLPPGIKNTLPSPPIVLLTPGPEIQQSALACLLNMRLRTGPWVILRLSAKPGPDWIAFDIRHRPPQMLVRQRARKVPRLPYVTATAAARI